MADVRALVLVDDVVVNTVVASEAFAVSQGWRFGPSTASAQIGWTLRNGAFFPPIRRVPEEVSSAQAKTALYQAGIYDDVEAVLSAAPDGLVRIWWQSAQVWRRDHPYILAVATFLDPPLDDDQVDALFVAAAAVPT